MDPRTGDLIPADELASLKETNPDEAARFSVALEGAADAIQSISDAVKQKARSIGEAITDAVGEDDVAKASSPSTQMAVALNHKDGPTYAGTVDKATVQKRRTKNKAARRARRANR